MVLMSEITGLSSHCIVHICGMHWSIVTCTCICKSYFIINWQDIQAQAGKDSREPPRDYSGSDLATSSDQESSEDDRLTTGSSPEYSGTPDVVPVLVQMLNESTSGTEPTEVAANIDELGSTSSKKKRL